MKRLILILIMASCIIPAMAIKPIEIYSSFRTGEQSTGIDCWRVKSLSHTFVKGWKDSFAPFPSKITNTDSYWRSIYLAYSILKTDPAILSDMKINKHQLVWLCMFSSMLLDKWNSDGYTKSELETDLERSINEIASTFTKQEVLEAVKWSVDSRLTCINMICDVQPVMADRETYDILFASVINHMIGVLGQDTISSYEAQLLAMRARLRGYDGAVSPMEYARKTMDYRAIDVMLRWGDMKQVIAFVNEKFNPSDTNKLINNLWIAEIFIRYNLTQEASKLILKGDETTQSILLKTAFDNFDKYNYAVKDDLRPLMHNLQSFLQQ